LGPHVRFRRVQTLVTGRTVQAQFCLDVQLKVQAENLRSLELKLAELRAANDLRSGEDRHTSVKLAEHQIAIAELRHNEFPWIEVDRNGDIIPETASSERIAKWLDAEAGPDLLEYWGERTGSQYAPGFALMASLTAGNGVRWA
jgi:hypothetical protein